MSQRTTIPRSTPYVAPGAPTSPLLLAAASLLVALASLLAARLGIEIPTDTATTGAVAGALGTAWGLVQHWLARREQATGAAVITETIAEAVATEAAPEEISEAVEQIRSRVAERVHAKAPLPGPDPSVEAGHRLAARPVDLLADDGSPISASDLDRDLLDDVGLLLLAGFEQDRVDSMTPSEFLRISQAVRAGYRRLDDNRSGRSVSVLPDVDLQPERWRKLGLALGLDVGASEPDVSTCLDYVQAERIEGALTAIKGWSPAQAAKFWANDHDALDEMVRAHFLPEQAPICWHAFARRNHAERLLEGAVSAEEARRVLEVVWRALTGEELAPLDDDGRPPPEGSAS